MALLANVAPWAHADDSTSGAALNAAAVPQLPPGLNATPLANVAGGWVQAPANLGKAPTSSISSSADSAKSFLSGVAGKAGDVVVSALNMIGVRYRWGGNTPDSGLDCSGFVRYVFQDTLGMSLPRRAEEMSQVGEKVSFSNLKPGDLVFFNTMRRAASHVGIYIGNNKFVHSPSTGSTIRVDDIDNAYWESRFTGARRMETVFRGSADAFRQRVSATFGGSNGTPSNTDSDADN